MSSKVIRKFDFQKILFNAINLNKINRFNRLGIAINHKPESLALAGLLRECLPKDALLGITIDLKLNADNSNKIIENRQKIENFGVKVNALECSWNRSESVIHENQSDQVNLSSALNKKIINHKIHSMLINECKKNNITILAFGNTLEDYLAHLLKEIYSQKAGYINGMDILSSLGVFGDRINVLRPLLKYDMSQILATCKEYQLFSDNYDHKLDYSNTVKQMLYDACNSESKKIGDTFLTVPKLLDLGFQLFQHRMEVWRKAIFKRDIRCDETLGLFFIKIDIAPHDVEFHWMNDMEITHTIFTILLAMINGLDPLHTKFSIEILEKFRMALMNTSMKKVPVSAAKGLLNPPRASDTGRGVWIFGRQPFTKLETKDLSMPMIPGATVLWDNRFKVSISPKNTDGSYTIRPFTIQDFTVFEDYLQNLCLPIDTAYSFKEKLTLFKTRTPLLLRQGLPCIERNGNIICIPSLGINLDKDLVVNFRYCGYKSAFGEVVGLTSELFESEPEESDSESFIHADLLQ